LTTPKSTMKKTARRTAKIASAGTTTTTTNKSFIEIVFSAIDNERLVSLCGQHNGNLKQIEKNLDVAIHNRGATFQIFGENLAIKKAEKVIRSLYDATKSDKYLAPAEVHLYIQDINASAIGEISEVVDENAGNGSSDSGNITVNISGDKSEGATAASHTSSLAIKTPKITIKPRGKNQVSYIKNITQHDINFSIGPAGTGKTYLAVACAVVALLREEVERIVLVRPVVEAGEHLGFLPGDISQKVDPYLRPLYDALYDMLGAREVEKLLASHIIEIAPLAFMRGRTLNAAFIILDESQNSTPEQMQMFLTRMGFGSKAIITGDITQIDLAKGRPSGLVNAMDLLQEVKGISFNFFDAHDVVRHPLVQRIVQAYAKHKIQIQNQA
jgi:phosphate starvation-inducible protein PhoH and related proteins